MGDIYDSTSYQPRKSIGALLSRVRVAMLAALDEELAADRRLAALELSAAQFSVIASLAGEERKSASDLCKGISYDAGAMTRMLDRLEGKGLIRRNRSPDDRRLVHLELTDEGRALYPRMRELSLGVANRFLRGFTKAEARQLESLLARMLENTQEPAVRASA
ncbi:MAG TPA: MarR family transcriptional regulator [Steroidobacteraceae bacterium]|nr:MarR family transcriptional regulator [Steroidobacteraceae bacterium]